MRSRSLNDAIARKVVYVTINGDGECHAVGRFDGEHGTLTQRWRTWPDGSHALNTLGYATVCNVTNAIAGKSVTADGEWQCTQSGALTVGNTATFATAKTANVVLTEATNAFNTVAVTQAKDVTLTDTDAIVLGKVVYR